MSIGTPQYMAPEVLRQQEYTPLADQYSLAVTIYEAIAGELPYQGSNLFVLRDAFEAGHQKLDQLPGNFPAAASQAIDRALSQSPADRFSSCREFAKAFLKSLPSEEDQPSKPSELPTGMHAEIGGSSASGDAVIGGKPIAPSVPVAEGPSSVGKLFAEPPIKPQSPFEESKPVGKGISKPVLFGSVALLLAILLAGGLYLSNSFSGAAPQAQTESGNENQIKLNEALSELSAKSQQLENQNQSLEKQQGKVREALNRSLTLQKLLNGKIQNEEESKTKLVNKVKELQDLISLARASETKSASVNGRNFSAAEFDRVAQTVANSFENSRNQLNGYQESAEVIEGSVSFLTLEDEKVEEAKKHVAAKVDHLDSKRQDFSSLKLEILRDPENDFLKDQLAKLQKAVEEINVEVDFQVGLEKDRLDAISKKQNEIDAILIRDQGTGFSGALSIIDKFLNDIDD